MRLLMLKKFKMKMLNFFLNFKTMFKTVLIDDILFIFSYVLALIWWLIDMYLNLDIFSFFKCKNLNKFLKLKKLYVFLDSLKHVCFNVKILNK